MNRDESIELAQDKTTAGAAAESVWVCQRCGRAHHGRREPIHCTGCGGTQFKGGEAILVVPGLVRGILAEAETINRSLERIGMMLRGSGHRKRRQIFETLKQLHKLTQRLTKYTAVPEPTRHGIAGWITPGGGIVPAIGVDASAGRLGRPGGIVATRSDATRGNGTTGR